MKVLIISYYAAANLSSSAAQNTRLLASSLTEAGYQVRVICAGENEDFRWQQGYRITELPVASRAWNSKWLGPWRSDSRIREFARRELASWHPDVMLIGAWASLSEFAIEGQQQGIPVVQILHDYSLLCLQQWLLDSSGSLCSGPTSQSKCRDCLRSTLGPRASLQNRFLSMPLVPSLARILFGATYVSNHHVGTAVGDAFAHMTAFRKAITLFIAQAPSVVNLLGTAGISPDHCRFLPQFIGNDKLAQYPRPKISPGPQRPMRLAYVGRWSREKGPDILLDAFVTAEVSIELELWVISSTKDLSILDGLDSDSKHIKIVQGATGSTVSKFLAQCDLCVVPSRCQELASRVVLEAHAQGVPVVASSSVGNSYLIADRENGRIFQTSDTQALRSCIEEIAASPDAIKEWSRYVPPPVKRDEWVRTAVGILEEAILLGPTATN